MKQLWLIPALPLAGFLLNGLVALVASSMRAEKESGADHPGVPLPYAQRLFHGVVGVGSVGLAAVLSFAALVPYALGSMQVPDGLAPIVQKVYTWMAAGDYTVDVAFRLDTLSALMLSFVTLVGTLIHVYSVVSMHNEDGYGLYFSYLNLFMFAMLTLVLADSLPLLFVGWEGVGLCSYLLIGYYYDKDFAVAAGKKAFIANRVGDFGMVLGIFGVFALFGTADFSFVELAKRQVLAGNAPLGVYAVFLLLFLGACGKSAQGPLYVWLPDAMAGPTPVSALIHAATMVTAGVYMVARCNVFYRISHEWALKTLGESATVWGLLTHDASFVVAVIGGATALLAATMGLTQTDIKKVLAYSTGSQLGYMFLGCGALAFSAGMFHVFTHAWFKACLFLGAGSVIHALGGEQDMTKMGGLRKLIPHTFLTMFVATIAIAGVPPFAGFFSKDAILGETYAAGYKVLWGFAILTAGLTAFYMFRLMRMTFFGTFRGTPEQLKHVHESPASMTVPLYVLAALSLIVGWFGLPKFIFGRENSFERFLEPVITPLAAGWQPHLHEIAHSTELGLMVTSVVIAFLGIFLAVSFYSGAYPFAMPERIASSLGGFYRLVRDKYRVDEFYEAVFVNGLIKKGGRLLWEIDARVVDLIPNGAAGLAVGLSNVSSWFDRTFVDGAVTGVGNTFQAAFRGMHRFQTGRTQNYALTMAFGIFGFVCLYLLLK